MAAVVSTKQITVFGRAADNMRIPFFFFLSRDHNSPTIVN